MDYYLTMRNDFIHKEMYPTDARVDFVPKGPLTGPAYTLKPKEICVPKFTCKIEGSAVEEGARVFFEGIVDAQPPPVFSWFFNDEPIKPGRAGWEDIEVHDCRKMSTLILSYAREHHMGKYTLVAKNTQGHAVCNCDLIVRKKQFPPVFWKRLYNYETSSGTKIVAEIEVGGWPVPEISWFKDEEPLVTKCHTENYNGYFNAYVPEARVEVVQLDDIRHCIIFHHINESDSGVYVVRAVNALGEAVCEAEIEVEPGDGVVGSELYLPEKWRTGNRLDWAAEDKRIKLFVGHQEPELTDEDIKMMTSRVAGAPLPRALEYLASLPDYHPVPMQGLLKMDFTGEPIAPPDEQSKRARAGRRGGKASRPSKFIPGDIVHRGYGEYDDGQRILPKWANPTDRNEIERIRNIKYSPYHPNLPDARPRPPEKDGPPCPHVWESHETVDELYKLLDTVGCRIISDTSKISKSNVKEMTSMSSTSTSTHITSHETAVAKSKSQVKKFSYLSAGKGEKEGSETAQVKSSPSMNRKAKQWEDKLNANKAGIQSNAEDFTNEFMQDMYSQSSMTNIETREETMKKEEKQGILDQYDANEALSSKQQQTTPILPRKNVQSPPALPPKTKIMNSPSRHLFSPTSETNDSAVDGGGTYSSSNDTATTVEYIPVREKVKMIAQQQEEIVRREEMKRAKSGIMKSRGDGGFSPPTGGIRILPPSPVTVRHEETDSASFPAMANVETSMSMSKTASASSYKESKQFSSVSSSSEAKVGGEKLQASASQSSVGHSLSQTSIGGSSTQSVYDMMYDAQVLSPIMSSTAIPFLDDATLSSMAQSKLINKSQEEVVVRRGEMSRTNEMVQQKSESVSTNQYKSEARIQSSGKKMLIPCLEDKYDDGDITPTGIPIDNMSLISEKSDTASSVQTLKDSSYSTTSYASSSQQQRYQKTTNKSQNNVMNKVSFADEHLTLPPPPVEIDSAISSSSTIAAVLEDAETEAANDLAIAEQVRRSFEEAELEAMMASEAQQRSTKENSKINVGKSTQSTIQQKHIVQAAPLQESPKNQPDLKKQTSSPSSKFATPTNSVPSSPFVARRLKVNQSPVPSVGSEEQQGVKYRTPPSTPFQPMFYKIPSNIADDESSEPAFKLLGQQVPSQESPIKGTSKKGPDTNSSQQKKLRRKKREEKRLAGSNNKGKQVEADSSENELDDQKMNEFFE